MTGENENRKVEFLFESSEGLWDADNVESLLQKMIGGLKYLEPYKYYFQTPLISQVREKITAMERWLANFEAGQNLSLAGRNSILQHALSAFTTASDTVTAITTVASSSPSALPIGAASSQIFPSCCRPSFYLG